MRICPRASPFLHTCVCAYVLVCFNVYTGVFKRSPHACQTSSSLLLSSLELSDTKVYEPQVRASLGTTAHVCRASGLIGYESVSWYAFLQSSVCPVAERRGNRLTRVSALLPESHGQDLALTVSYDIGTHKTVKARFWPWLSGKSAEIRIHSATAPWTGPEEFPTLIVIVGF